MKDRKIRFIETVKLYFKGRDGVKETIENSKAIQNEFNDLSQEELQELSPIIAEAYEVSEDKTDYVIRNMIIPTWSIIENTARLIGSIRELKGA